MAERNRPTDQRTTSQRGRTIPIRFKPNDTSLEPVEKTGLQPEEELGTEEQVEGIQGVYIISVAARLLRMHPQTLRKYERLGLVSPSRTLGMLRLYSQGDIEKLRLIRHLEGNLRLNLAGVEMVLRLLSSLLQMQRQLAQLEEAEDVGQMIQEELQNMLNTLFPPDSHPTSGSDIDDE